MKKKKYVILAVAICFISGCSSSKATQIHVDVDRDGKCSVDGDPCGIATLNTKLTPKRNRAMSMGGCSVRVSCASNLTSSIFFQVVDQASQSGIWKVTLQLAGNTELVDCSRPTEEQLPEVVPPPNYGAKVTAVTELLTIEVSDEHLVVNGSQCSLSDLTRRLKGKTGKAIVKAHGSASLADTHAVLRTCKSLSLKAYLFQM
jgi:hypothetical protein